MKRFMNKKVAAIGLAAGLVLGIAGAATAYFTASGNGTGQASVGSNGTWAVAQSGSAVGSVVPGSGTSIVTFTATNNGPGGAGIDSATQVTVSVNSKNGDITQGGTELVGCSASWFSASLDSAGPTPAYATSVASGDSYSIPVDVTMSDSGTNQDVCIGATPDIDLSIAS